MKRKKVREYQSNWNRYQLQTHILTTIFHFLHIIWTSKWVLCNELNMLWFGWRGRLFHCVIGGVDNFLIISILVYLWEMVNLCECILMTINQPAWEEETENYCGTILNALIILMASFHFKQSIIDGWLHSSKEKTNPSTAKNYESTKRNKCKRNIYPNDDLIVCLGAFNILQIVNTFFFQYAW